MSADSLRQDHRGRTTWLDSVQKALKDEDEQRRGACPTGFWSGAMMGIANNRQRRAPN
jgi:hypothetical protein